MGDAAKAAKKVAKTVIKNPKAAAGVAAAPFTGGASLAVTGKEVLDDTKKAKKSEAQERAQQQAVLEAKREADATEERRKRKMSDLAGREEGETTGLSSLIGKGKSLG